MEKHAVDLNALIEWQSTEKVLFASSSSEKKKLFCNFRGGYEVWHNNELVFETMQPYNAVEKYNEIK